jgi:large subunit ribosomal protein L3
MAKKKFTGTKMKMTSVFKDGRMYGVTPVKLSEKSEISEIKAGTRVMLSGTSKGHGFTGGVKRWNFKGGPATHGQKNRHRAPGSIGNTTPQRVLPGRHMAGHMGMERITSRNIAVVAIDEEKRVVMLNGSVPGITGIKMEIRVGGITK